QAPLADRALDDGSKSARDIAEELVAGIDQFFRSKRARPLLPLRRRGFVSFPWRGRRLVRRSRLLLCGAAGGGGVFVFYDGPGRRRTSTRRRRPRQGVMR